MTEYSKRHELPESEDDLKSIFDALIRPVQEASIDRLMRDIMSSAEWVEIQINEGTTVSNDSILDSLGVLNDDLDQNGISDEPLIFSGKLRPVLDTDLTSDGVTVLDIELPPEIMQFGELKRDDEGLYLEVWQQEVTCGTFGMQAKRGVHFGDTDRHYQGILLNLGLKVTPTSRELPFYAYLDDVQGITTKELTYMGIYEKIDNDYPEVAEQISQLSADCRNDQKIIRELSEFYIEIDWANYPKHTSDERQALIEYIETYITSRVNMDTAPYEMWVRDYLYGVNQDNQQVISELAHEQRLTLTVSQLRLEELETEDSIQRFSIMVEALAPARGRGAGNHILYIPAANIAGIRNKRNNSFRPRGFQPPQEDTLETAVEPVEGERALLPQPDSAPETPYSKEQDLIDLENMFETLMSEASRYTTEVYETIEEARVAREKAVEIIGTFRDNYPLAGVTLEASGPGVAIVKATWGKDDVTYTEETDILGISIKAIGTEYDNPLAIEKGLFNGEIRTMIGYDQTKEGYTVTAYVMCKSLGDLTTEPLIFGLDELGVPLFQLTPERLMAFEVNNERVAVSIPEYTRIRRARAVIARIKNVQETDMSEMAGDLETLLTYMIENSRKEFTQFPDIDLLTRIGQTAGSDASKIDFAVAALEDMFIDRIIHVQGELYDSAGDLVESGMVRGKVHFVVPDAPNISVHEPMIVFQGSPDESVDGNIPRIYAPLSKLTVMVY